MGISALTTGFLCGALTPITYNLGMIASNLTQDILDEHESNPLTSEETSLREKIRQGAVLAGFCVAKIATFALPIIFSVGFLLTTAANTFPFYALAGLIGGLYYVGFPVSEKLLQEGVRV